MITETGVEGGVIYAVSAALRDEILAKGMATAGESVSRLIGKPPLLGAGQLHFQLWGARADSSRARSELGVEFTPWQEGVRATVRWMADTGRI